MADIDLSNIEFFDGFASDELEKILAMSEDVVADPGAQLMRQGDVGREAFFIISGQAAVDVAATRVATVGPGSMIGEMALIDLRPRSATISALTEMNLLRFDRKKFLDLLELMPDQSVQALAEKSDQTRKRNLGRDDI